MKDAKGSAKYIGRYLARPAIAEYRIINYDGKKVKFWHIEHESNQRKEEELDALDFIGKLIMHIPKKHFKMVRRYGLYRRDINKLAQEIVSLYKYIKTKKKQKPQKAKKKTWKERMKESINKNPIMCPKCKKEMELWAIWHPRYGLIYDELEESEKRARVKNEEKRRRNGLGRNTLSKWSRRQEPSQLLLPEMWF